MTILILILSCMVAQAQLEHLDLSKCKVTHIGSEYIGTLAVTGMNNTCQYWASSTEKGVFDLSDAAFPDGSKKLAWNHCRNPNLSPDGPWCFTTNKKQIAEECDIRLCKSEDCRFTGPGMEYMGNIARTVTGKRCSPWWKNQEVTLERWTQWKNNSFPEGSVAKAKNKCRNPDGSLFGPWCYAQEEGSELEIAELCDVPFCHEIHPLMYSEGRHNGMHYFFTHFNGTKSLKLNVKLWDPEAWKTAQIFILISALDVFGSRSDFLRWNSFVEIKISNLGSGILNSEEKIIRSTPNILSAVRWTSIDIVWSVSTDYFLIQVLEGNSQVPFLVDRLRLSNGMIRHAPFRYYSLSGTRSLWKSPGQEDECHIHTTSLMKFTRYWLMKKTTISVDLDIFVRARTQATILFRSSPAMETGQIQMILGDGEKIKLVFYKENKSKVDIGETSYCDILNFWEWRNIKVRFVKDNIRVFWEKKDRIDMVFNATHPSVAHVRWVSFASPTTSYWSVYCNPTGSSDPPLPQHPECVDDVTDDFNGTTSVTEQGYQCIPWVDDLAVPPKYQEEDLFKSYGGRAFCQNFCRNLDRDSQGAFCFVRVIETGKFEKKPCHIRSCSLGECRLSGTAKEYSGHLKVTRSKRLCQHWINKRGEKDICETNFPDASLEDASNFCRNPSQNLGGPWCFTTDPSIPTDFCFIKDCHRSLECTIIASKYVCGHHLFVLPKWRRDGLKFWLKTWNPDIYEGFEIRLFAMNGGGTYVLQVGFDYNEKVRLIYISDSGERKLLILTTMLHLVPAGRWGGFWLRPGNGKIELGRTGEDKPFFEWSTNDPKIMFDPAYLDFGTLLGHWIGVNFPCSECLLERTTSNEPNRFYPINLWKEDTSGTTECLPKKLRLNFRGSANLAILLMSSPDFNDHMSVKLSSDGEQISIWEFKYNLSDQELVQYNTPSSFSEDRWTEYEFTFKERSIALCQDKTEVFVWSGRQRLLFYWFSVKVYEGFLIWSANCPPRDIDGPPRDGQWGPWGPWACSVSCGGGFGRVERQCNNPSPNVFGTECKGKAYYEGPCNTFPCGEITPITRDLIRYYLSTHNNAYEANFGCEVVLTCNCDAIYMISQEVKSLNVTWFFNGFPYNRKRASMSEDYSLVIPKVSDQDNGVYLCIAYPDPECANSKVVIDVISLIVNSSVVQKKIRRGKSLHLKCNGFALSYVYADLSQSWELNDCVRKDYGITTLETVASDWVKNVTQNDDGIWICVVSQNDLGFRWKTNRFHVSVRPTGNFWTHLKDHKATAPLFCNLDSERKVKIAFYSLAIGAFVLAMMSAFLLLRCLVPSCRLKS